MTIFSFGLFIDLPIDSIRAHAVFNADQRFITRILLVKKARGHSPVVQHPCK
jgi:hypothetical protein